MSPETQRQRCEIFSRVVGYLRPIDQWNDGKRAEFKMRTLYDKDIPVKKVIRKKGEANY